jgi:hypothetical protein
MISKLTMCLSFLAMFQHTVDIHHMPLVALDPCVVVGLLLAFQSNVMPWVHWDIGCAVVDIEGREPS